MLLTQNHRGRATTNEVWVFGLVDTSHTPALCYKEVVAQRDAATLLPIIQAHVAPGTIIHYDQWAAYNQVSSLPNWFTFNSEPLRNICRSNNPNTYTKH